VLCFSPLLLLLLLLLAGLLFKSSKVL